MDIDKHNNSGNQFGPANWMRFPVFRKCPMGAYAYLCLLSVFFLSLIHCSVAFRRYDGPFISIMNDLNVSLSTMAAAIILLVKISSHLSKPRLVVMMVDFMPALNDMWLNRCSAATLSSDL